MLVNLRNVCNTCGSYKDPCPITSEDLFVRPHQAPVLLQLKILKH
jgi:hypothetical protein